MSSKSGETDGRARRASGGRTRKLSQLPLHKRLLFLAILTLMPLALLGAIEGVLRLTGFGGYPPTFREVGTLDDGSSLILTDAMGPNSYFFASRSQGLALDPVAFRMPKPEGTIRVMWVGGSAAKGIPQPRSLRGSAFLETMLQDLWPDREVEVINVGTPGIGSYPVLGITTEALDYDPDLVVAYLGNNEFYGAYGVTSLHAAGRSPIMLRVTRAVRSTAIAQALDQALRGRVVRDPSTLMEAMVGQSFVAPDDPAREAAAANLRSSVTGIIDRCRARGVPVIVCTPPCNEAGMAPLGEPDLAALAPADAERIADLIAQARAQLPTDPAKAEALLREVIGLHETHATAHHLLARALDAQGRTDEAAAEYHLAVDMDPMPWRPPTSSIDAIRAAVESRQGVLVDLADIFRETSPTGAVGWELIEDHVHPSLRGQVLVARSVVQELAKLDTPLPLDPGQVEALPDWQTYAERRGASPFTRYAVAHSMTRFGSISFFARSTPQMKERNARICERIELEQPPHVLAAMRRWAAPDSTMIDSFPLSGLVAEAKLLAGEFEEASRLYRVAADNAMPYRSRRVAFVYFALYAEQQATGRLSPDSVSTAREAIEEGRFLIDAGWSANGQAERFVGQLHQLLGEHAEAIPYLTAARARVTGGHLVATDSALVRAYLATDRAEDARKIIEQGLLGPSAASYQRMADLLP